MRDKVNARAGVEGEVDSDRERWKKERAGGKVGGNRGCGRQQRSAAAAAGTGQRSKAGAETAQKAGKGREKAVLEARKNPRSGSCLQWWRWKQSMPIELQKHRRTVANESSPVSDSSSASDEEGSAFEEEDEGTDNSASSSSLSLEAEVSGSSGNVDMTELRSKRAHEKGVSKTPRVKRLKKRGVAPVIEMRSKRVHDKGGCSEVESRIPMRSLGKVDNVPGKRERERGNKGKFEVEGGMVVEKEGKGIGDAIVRHRCALEAVCSLNSELEECQKSTIEGTVRSPVLKYKPFVIDRHLVRALVESWVPKSKAFRIGQREGEGPCEVEDMVKAMMDDHISRERVSGAELPGGSNRGHKGEDPIKEKLIDAWVRNDTSGMACFYVWFYEHTNLYAHADDKCVPCIASWVNLYIGRKYDATQLISTIKDNQIVPYLKIRDLERREATVKAFSEIEDFNAYVEDAQGIISIEERLRRMREALKIATEALMYLFHTNFHATEVGSAEDAQEGEPFGDAMQPEGENEMVVSPYWTEGDVVPTLECDTEQPHADAIGEEGDVCMAGEESNSSIAKRIWRSPRRRQPSVKQISLFVNRATAPRTGKHRMGNVYTFRKQCRMATPNTSKEKELEEIRGGTRQPDNVVATDMAVVVPVAAAGGPVHGPRGIHDTIGHFEEAQGRKTDTGIELTTLADSTPTVAAGHAPIPQGGQNMSAVLGAVHTSKEPVTVRDSETTATVDSTGPPISQVQCIPLPMPS
ncbi:hypothetical protein Cgig2_011650 [Carnegiea gigantea]|uniref:Uncharacterized protein n=1 Tax=Carnegiea gigantea TaxID=171969 RepID=A0A9Q1Q4G5_9CARY|nr:hypothetical protein Cgig2_011650 [Carnegiea gigantea]